MTRCSQNSRQIHLLGPIKMEVVPHQSSIRLKMIQVLRSGLVLQEVIGRTGGCSAATKEVRRAFAFVFIVGKIERIRV
jgi:hypothetical protein